MNQKDPIIIASAVRTPIGNLQGSLKDLSTTDLGAAAIKAAVAQANLNSDAVDTVIMGCVLPAGLGQAPARQAALKGGLSNKTDCTTVNKMCGSGMKSIMLGFDALQANPDSVVIAGGMESMTNAPFLLPKARQGYRFGHQKVLDHMLLDGLEDAYEPGTAMGVFAERCAVDYQFTREAQDEFATESLRRAKEATDSKVFQNEIVPIHITTPKGEEQIIAIDEGPTTAKPEKIPTLRPAFSKDGTITAANSSSISDGAAVITLMHLEQAQKLGIKPLAKIAGHTTYSGEPSQFPTAPIFAIQRLLKKLNWQVSDVDLWEINEAFAVVAMAATKELNLPPDRVNMHGGGCVLGHPIGASGARIVVTLLHAMLRTNAKRGVAALCIGGGEATALAIELL